MTENAGTYWWAAGKDERQRLFIDGPYPSKEEALVGAAGMNAPRPFELTTRIMMDAVEEIRDILNAEDEERR